MLLENISEPRSKQTEFLLKCISTRLSGREDCKNISYLVKIDHNGVTMSPLVYVYKNRYSRKETDRLDIISFVHQFKMKGARLSQFVFGTYEYQQLPNSKRRRWRRIE